MTRHSPGAQAAVVTALIFAILAVWVDMASRVMP